MKLKRTRTRLTLLLSFIVLVLCTGCPYESEFPMTGKILKYDPAIIGSWKNGKTDLTISRIDEQNFRFQYNDHDEDFGAGLVKGNGYIILQNDTEFAIIEQGTSPKKYFVYKINSIRPNTIEVNPLYDDTMEGETFSSASAFTRHILTNEKAIFDGLVETYTRKR